MVSQFNEFTFIYISQKQRELIQINSTDVIFNTFSPSKNCLLYFPFFLERRFNESGIHSKDSQSYEFIFSYSFTKIV